MVSKPCRNKKNATKVSILFAVFMVLLNFSVTPVKASNTQLPAIEQEKAVPASKQNLPLVLTGQRVQGGLLIGQLKAGQQVMYNRQPLQLDKQQRFILGLDRDADAIIELTVFDVDSGALPQIIKLAIEPRQYQIQHIEGVSKKYIAPSAKQLARNRREALLVKQARMAQRSQNNFFDGFIWPLEGPITGVFGSQRVYNGEPRRPHYGVDIARAVGTPIVAPAGGKIALAKPDLFFSGGTLIIDHGHGLSSSFLHLSEILVEQGQQVEQGQVVAKVGATGRVTGAHLDWRMNWSGTKKNVRIDPQLLVAPMAEAALNLHE